MRPATDPPTVLFFALDSAVREGRRREAARAQAELARLGYVVRVVPQGRCKRGGPRR